MSADSHPGFARVCLTPTRNESWIIRHFLAAATNWADHIVVADQRSSDGTADLARAFPGVQVIANDSPTYNEDYRQRLLLGHARRIRSRRILLGLDADEALSANALGSRDWDRIEAAAPGTILRFRWVNILPGFTRAWVLPEPAPFGFIDDGSDHTGRTIHSARVPQPPGAPTLDLEDIVVLHFQYVAWERMASKQRWYQAWEHVQHGCKGPLDIFRQYHHMHGSWKPHELQPLRPEWLAGYTARGIDFRTLVSEPVTWWDRDLVEMLYQHGAAHFRRLAIWNHDWNDVARRVGFDGVNLDDPRSPVEKLIHQLLARTQNRRGNWAVRGFERVLRVSGW